MSSKEYANCVYARQEYEPNGPDHGYTCYACKRHYCLVEEGDCPYYKSKWAYKMVWIAGNGYENLRVAVPKEGYVGPIYHGKSAYKPR